MSDVAFTLAQEAAADVAARHLDSCIVAGPGSGKTTVLVEYFRRLVAAGADPLRILAITFTEKAAGNMRSKLAAAFGEDPTIRARLERAWVSTIHGFCARLLRENAVFAGVDPEFRVADERESLRLLYQALEAAIEETFRVNPEGMSALIRGIAPNRFSEAVLSAYDAIRSAGVPVGDLASFPPLRATSVEEIGDTLLALGREEPIGWTPKQKGQYLSAIETGAAIVHANGTLEALRAASAFSCQLNRCKKSNNTYNLLSRLKDQVTSARLGLLTEYYAGERAVVIEILGSFDRLYCASKRRAGALDFSDLEAFTVALLESHDQIREQLRAQFDHILIDEFQDTNGQQARLMSLMRAPDRFYAVGDINQSIFGFRHAEPRGFEAYREEVARSGRRLVELADNFRSRPHILSAVETVLDSRDGVERRDLIAQRKFASDREVSVEVVYTEAGEQEEALLVAQRILELTGTGQFAFQDIAVLVRNTEVFVSFTAAFERTGIPYVVNRGKGFYESREVNDLTHLLRVIANPRDEISLATVLRSPLVGVSDEVLLRLRVMAEGGLRNIGAVLMHLDDASAFSSADGARLLGFRDRLRMWRTRREYVSFDRLLLSAIDDCGYPAAPNIDKFLTQARQAAARMSLDEFVEELSLVRATKPREPDTSVEDSSGTVKMMTVHSAKGLEFPVVFIATLDKGINTSLGVVEFSRQFGLGVTWRDPGTGDEQPDLYQSAIADEREKREKAESHRLLYVAMTRAEELLVLSFSRTRNWAKVVTESLNLSLDTPCDQVLLRHAPDGKPWNLRLLVADGAPEIAQAAAAAAAATPALGAAVELLTPPRVSEQHDTNTTVTAISAFANCPRRYYLGWYLGYEGRARKLTEADSEADADLSAGEFGTQVHALLAGAPLTGEAQPDPVALRLAEVFRQSPLGRRAARATRIEREFDFLLAIEDVVIRGQIDLWFEEAGELVIVDYKTDAVTSHEAHRRAADYSLQLRLYAMAVERAAGRPPDRAYLHFLRPDTAVEVDVTPSLLESPEQIVADLKRAQDSLEFPLHEAEHCHRCPFWHGLCPARG